MYRNRQKLKMSFKLQKTQVVFNVNSGDVKISNQSFSINMHEEQNKKEKKMDKEKMLQESASKDFLKKFNLMPIVKQISNKLLRDQFQLSSQSLDSRGDRDFVNEKVPKMQMRGGLPYFQPNGWIRYGLNVSIFTEFDGNDRWLMKDGNDGEWAVFYHGIRIKNFLKIIIQTGLKIGHNQSHENKQLFVPEALYQRISKNPKALYKYMKEKTVGRGIYGSPLINQDCLNYLTGIILGDQQYKVVLQCRINPQKVYISNSKKSYWIVREPQYIRPYGLLIGKLSDIQKQQNITQKFNLLFRQFQGTSI